MTLPASETEIVEHFRQLFEGEKKPTFTEAIPYIYDIWSADMEITHWINWWAARGYNAVELRQFADQNLYPMAQRYFGLQPPEPKPKIEQQNGFKFNPMLIAIGLIAIIGLGFVMRR